MQKQESNGKMKLYKVKCVDFDKRLIDKEDDLYEVNSVLNVLGDAVHYLTLHLNGTNKQPWRDVVLTRYRNAIRESASKAASNEVKRFLEDIVKVLARIKNEKSSLQEGIKRINEFGPKVFNLKKKLMKEYEDLKREIG